MSVTRYQVRFDGVEGADSAVRSILLADLNFSLAEVDAILSGRGTVIVDTDNYEFASITVGELKKAGGKVKLLDLSGEESEESIDFDIEFSMEDIISRPNSVAYEINEGDLSLLDISEPEVGDLIASLGSGLVLGEDEEKDSINIKEPRWSSTEDLETMEDGSNTESQTELSILDSEMTLAPLEEEIEPSEKGKNSPSAEESIENFWQMSLDILPEEELEASSSDSKLKDKSIESEDLFSFVDEADDTLPARGLEKSSDKGKQSPKSQQKKKPQKETTQKQKALSDSDFEFSLDDESLIIADEENGVQGLEDSNVGDITISINKHKPSFQEDLFDGERNSIITEDFKQRVKSEAIPMPEDNFDELPSSLQKRKEITPPNYMTIVVVSVGIVVIGILYFLMTESDDLEIKQIESVVAKTKALPAASTKSTLEENYNLQQVNVLKAKINNKQLQSSEFECVLIDNLARCRFEIETVPPPELTELEIVKGFEIRPWLRKLSLQTIQLNKISENTYGGFAQARVYVDLPERLRIVAAVALLLEIKPSQASLHIQVSDQKDKVDYQRIVPDEISIKTIRQQSKKKTDFFLATTIPLKVDESVAIAQPEILEAFQEKKTKDKESK